MKTVFFHAGIANVALCSMADPAPEANQASTTIQPAEKAKPKMIVGDLTPQVPAFFDTIEDASNFIAQCAGTYADWEAQASKLIVAGLDPESGEIDAATYPAGTRVMFHVLTNRGQPVMENGKKVGTTPATVKAMIVWPVPTYESMLADEQGIKWAQQKLDTQIAHVTVAKMRDAENIEAAARQMPGVVDVDGTPTYDMASFFAQRESGALTATYDALYKELLTGFNQRSKLWAKFRLNKSELRKALESKAYALSIYGPLEDRGDKPSMFVMALNAMIAAAKSNGLDPATLNTWLETRDSATATDDTDETVRSVAHVVSEPPWSSVSSGS